MSNKKQPTSKLKDLEFKKTLSAQTSPRHSLSARQSRPRSTMKDKIEKSENRNTYFEHQYKELFKHEIAEVEETNLISDFNASELSIIRMLDGENYKDASPVIETADKKYKDEIANLKKDLSMKNNLVERLMKENRDLRREMDELLSTMEEAKDKIASKLDECNYRVKELENEIKRLQEENWNYKNHIAELLASSSKAELSGLEKSIGKYCNDANEKIDVFYHHLNEQLVQFVTATKTQYEKISQTVHSKIAEPKKNQAFELNSKGSISARNSLPNRITTPKQTNPNVKEKGKGLLTIAMGLDTEVRDFSPVSTTRRKRQMTAQNSNDVASVVMTEPSKSNTGRLKTSPKGSLTARTQTKTSFRF